MEIEQHVKEAAAGDSAAFEALVGKYQSPVCAVAYGIVGDVALSEDVAQEAFVAAWKGLPSLRSPERFRSWLFAITKNIARTVLRKGTRDVLTHAVPVDRSDATTPPSEIPEAADAVWDALEQLPEQYRIPLVMYYREGESTASVATHLDISEAAARQRLSRGRKMLKDHVAHLVEDVLSNSQPSLAFTAAAMTAAGLGVSSTAVAQVGLTSATAAKGAALAGKGIAGGAAVYLLGPILGMTGGFFGMWTSIRNAQTLEIRRATLRHGGALYAGIWMFLGCISLAGLSLWGQNPLMAMAVVGAWLVYVPLLGLAIVLINRHQYRLAEAAVNGDVDTLGVESYPRCSRWVCSTFAVAVVGSLGLVAIVHPLPGLHWGWAAGLIALSHLVYAAMVRRGLAISIDEVAFEQSAPKQGPEAIVAPYTTVTTVSEKARMWNQVGGLAGGVIGGSAWLTLLMAQAGLYTSAVVLALAQLSILAIAARFLKANIRNAGTIACVSMIASGAITGGMLILNWRMSLGIEEYAPAYFNAVVAVAVFAIYVLFGVIAYYINPEQRDGEAGNVD